MGKMKIVPIRVPWMISPAYEIEKYYGGIATIDILLCCINSKKKQNEIIKELNRLYKNNIPENIWNKVGCLNIKLHFEPINYFGILYLQKEIFSLNEKIYDISLLKTYYDKNEYFDCYWNEKGICPDPKMYEVENSMLKRKLNITKPNIKHWLITGHEEEIHILSQKFTWIEEAN